MKNVIDVKVRNLSKSLPLPKYETDLAAGMDVMACFDCEQGIKGYDWFTRDFVEYPIDKESEITINPGERVLIPTGLKVEIPEGYEIQVRPRSGLALKYGITVLNTPGTIDADYRGMIGIILINLSNEPFVVNHGDRIAQIILKEVPKINWIPSNDLSYTNRGEGGFGSTSTKEVSDPESEQVVQNAVDKAEGRAPSFQVGDVLDGVGKIIDLKVNEVTGEFIYKVIFNGDTYEMGEQEIIRTVL